MKKKQMYFSLGIFKKQTLAYRNIVKIEFSDKTKF